MKKLSPRPYCSAPPAVKPPLAPSNTALADWLALVRSCHPPSRVREISPAPLVGAESITAMAARPARRDQAFAKGVIDVLAVEAEAGERQRGAQQAVTVGVVAPGSAEVLRRRFDRGLDRGRVRDALAIEERGQGRHVR